MKRKAGDLKAMFIDLCGTDLRNYSIVTLR